MTRREIEKAWDEAYSFREEGGFVKKESVDTKIEGNRIYTLWSNGEGEYRYTVEKFRGMKRVPEEIAVFGRRVSRRYGIY